MIKAMHTLIAAIHGIMTSQTDASWPDKFDAWMFERDPDVKVLKKEYRAGPFPRWNCWVTDPLLARTVAACEADVRKNQILEWYCNLQLGAAIAYSSEEDGVVAGDPRAIGGGHPARAARAWLWGKMMWNYGCLGRTGWVGGTPRSTVQNGGTEGLD